MRSSDSLLLPFFMLDTCSRSTHPWWVNRASGSQGEGEGGGGG